MSDVASFVFTEVVSSVTAENRGVLFLLFGEMILLRLLLVPTICWKAFVEDRIAAIRRIRGDCFIVCVITNNLLLHQYIAGY